MKKILVALTLVLALALTFVGCEEKSGADYVIELSVKNPADLTAKLNTLNIEKYSVIEYDSEDII